MIKILVVEDEIILGRLIKEALERKSFDVYVSKDGLDVLQVFKQINPQLCILDIMLPHVDGYDLARQLKEINNKVPVMFLSARSNTSDVLKGFESGGNDYLKKPFSMEELIVRVEELLKRFNYYLSEDRGRYTIGNYTFHPTKQMLTNGDRTRMLTHRETDLLNELIINRNNIIERKATLIKLWGQENSFNSRNMDVYIVRLRKYLSDDKNISIVNLKGIGYKLIDGN